MQQYLFIMLGYPGTGKSHFARQLARELHAVRINADSIRKYMYKNEADHVPKNNPVVFGALDYAADAVLQAGYSVVYDASHNRKVDRAKAADVGKPHGIKPVIIWMQTPLDVAMHRQTTREQTVDQVLVPEHRFRQLVASTEPPEAHELVIKINGQLPFDQQLASFRQQLTSH